MGYPGSGQGYQGQRPAVSKTAVYANSTSPAWGFAVRMREAVAGVKPAKANGVCKTPLCSCDTEWMLLPLDTPHRRRYAYGLCIPPQSKLLQSCQSLAVGPAASLKPVVSAR